MARVKYGLAAALISGLWSFMPLAPAQAQQVTMSAQERAAIEVVNGWHAAWDTKDPAKVASFMAKDVLYSPGYPTIILEQGRKRFLEENAPFIRAGVGFKTAEILAIGGTNGTVVLYRREDLYDPEIIRASLVKAGVAFPPENADAKPKARGFDGPGFFTNATLFWIKKGKIQMWLDIPMFGPPVSPAQAPPNNRWAKEEKAALDLVDNWVEGWNKKDINQVVSPVEPSILYSAYYPMYLLSMGAERYKQELAPLVARGIDMRIVQSLAVGGNKGIAVLTKRIDRFTSRGHEVEVPNAAFYWIVNGKIHTWLDIPLEPTPEAIAAAPGAPIH